MERLTEWYYGDALLPQCHTCNKNVAGDCGTCEYESLAILRLAAYEDTGLSPEEITAMAKDRAHICAGAQKEEHLSDKYPAAETELYEKAMLRLNRQGLKTRTQQIAYLEAEIERYRAKIQRLEQALTDATDQQKLMDSLAAVIPSLVQAIVENMPQLAEAYMVARAADPNKEG